MPPWLPAAIAGGTSVIGAGLGFMGAEDANAQSAGATHEANVINRANADRAFGQQVTEYNENIALQKEFAQNGLSWRIADAAKNGISPLAAMGASGPSFSPVMSVMPQTEWQTPSYQSPLSAVAAGIPEMGQNVSRALSSMQTPQQRQMDSLELARKQTENDLLGTQLLNAQFDLATRTAGAGLPLAYRPMRNADGTVTNYASEGLQAHNSLFGPTEWSLHNKLMMPFKSDYQVGPRRSSTQWKWGG